MNDFYSAMGIDIKNMQILAESISPFLKNPELNKMQREAMASMNSIILPSSDFIFLFNNVEFKERQKVMKATLHRFRFLEDSLVLNLSRNDLSALQLFYHQILNKKNTSISTDSTEKTFSNDNFLCDSNASKEVIPEILSDLDVSTFNTKTKEIFNELPENIDIELEEDNLKFVENFKSGIKEYNSNPDTKIKFKIPNNIKECCCSFFLFLFIEIIIICLSPHIPFDIVNHLNSILDGFAGSALYTEFQKGFQKIFKLTDKSKE